VEWKLCPYRADLFDEAGESLTMCPLHRDEFGLGWQKRNEVSVSVFTV